MIVAKERGWVTRGEAIARLSSMLDLLERAPCYHGHFPHFMNGRTGSAIPFTRKDDGTEGLFNAVLERGDMFMAMVRTHTPASGELSEQFDQTNGAQTSAKNLAWSHAAFITAFASRKAAVNTASG